MTAHNILWAMGAVISTFAMPAHAETFRCRSSHPEIWGVLTIAVDRAKATVVIQGDNALGPKLEFMNGRIGPVRRGTGVNQFGSGIVRQIVVISTWRILIGWLDPDGDFNYAATFRPDSSHCRLRQLGVDVG